MTDATALGRRVLLNAERQQEFDEVGYTVVPFLSADEVQALLDGYADLVPDADESIIVFDYTRDDRRVMEGVARLLSPVFSRNVPHHFAGHEAVFWTFVIKPSSPDSEMALHDDRTYVDESKHRACTVWVPLVDTSPELGNGCLCVVPGSHRIMPVASGTNIPNWFEPYGEYLLRYARPVSVPAGSALIYDTKTLHCSPPNLSGVPRPAIAAAVVPAGEPLIHVVGDGLNTRRVYAIDRQFYVDHHPYSVEEGMPEGYELVREYWEDRVSADPAAVALVGDPGDIPVPTGPATAPVPRDAGVDATAPEPQAVAAIPVPPAAPAPVEVPPTEPALSQARRLRVRLNVRSRLRHLVGR